MSSNEEPKSTTWHITVMVAGLGVMALAFWQGPAAIEAGRSAAIWYGAAGVSFATVCRSAYALFQGVRKIDGAQRAE